MTDVTDTVAALTVTTHFAVFSLPSLVFAVITACPGAIVSTNPFASTVATVLLSVLQVRLLSAALEGEIVGDITLLSPTFNSTLFTSKEIDSTNTGLGDTVI